MILEYAIEPEIVAVWGRRENYRRILERFGLNQRRLVSQFPKRWSTLVWKCFEESGAGRSPLDRARVEELVLHFLRHMPKREAMTHADDWLLSAETEHQHRSFSGIIASSNPRGLGFVLDGTDANALCDRLPYIPHQIAVERTPDGLASVVAPLLQRCNEIVFVDPHFNTSRRRYVKAFETYFTALANGRCAKGVPTIEIHTCIEQAFSPGEERNAEIERRDAQRCIIGPAEQALPTIIPRGLCATVVVWKERPSGLQLHNRFILTDVGSVSFGHGLDCYDRYDIRNADDGRPEDEITCLEEAVHKRRWEQYKGGTPAFERIVTSITIQGEKDL